MKQPHQDCTGYSRLFYDYRDTPGTESSH